MKKILITLCVCVSTTTYAQQDFYYKGGNIEIFGNHEWHTKSQTWVDRIIIFKNFGDTLIDPVFAGDFTLKNMSFIKNGVILHLFDSTDRYFFFYRKGKNILKRELYLRKPHSH